MRARLVLVVVPAVVLASADLLVKALVATPAWNFHERSATWSVGSGLLLLCAVALARLPSRLVAAAAGITSAGVLGNLVSAARSGGRVPNPLVVGGPTDGIAFNLADVLVLAGLLLLMPALAAVTIRHRDRLIPPRRWERALRRRLSRDSG
jgi:hypothetical protein